MLHINSCTSWDECAADKQIFCITCKATAAASSTSWIRRQKNSPNAWITSVADAAAAVVCNSNLYSLCWECVIRLDSCERSNGAFSLFAIKLWRVGTHNFRHHHFAIFHCIYNVALFYVCQSIPTYAQSTLYVHRAPCLYEAIILTHTHIRYTYNTHNGAQCHWHVGIACAWIMKNTQDMWVYVDGGFIWSWWCPPSE